MSHGVFKLNLTETTIRYAMANTSSAAAAARFLAVSIETFKKYASMYTDPETGKTLYELQKNRGGKGTKKPYTRRDAYTYLMETLEGKHQYTNKGQFKNYLIQYGIFPECCVNCGYDEKRIMDQKCALQLDFIDGNRNNLKKENLRFLCYNCFFNLVGNLSGRTTYKYDTE